MEREREREREEAPCYSNAVFIFFAGLSDGWEHILLPPLRYRTQNGLSMPFLLSSFLVIELHGSLTND